VIRALLATGNAGKASELQALLGFEVVPVDIDVEETEETFAGNALSKARAARAAAGSGEWGLGDDSGLAVAALGGEPGVHSRRWAGPDDDDRNRALLARLEGVGDRRATFVCALAAVAPDGTEAVAEGRLEGAIADAPSGDDGFGYDPVFVPEGERETLASLGTSRKNQVSHRARAATALRARLNAVGRSRGGV
jgi:XTP/dITP diphosphohydrolase